MFLLSEINKTNSGNIEFDTVFKILSEHGYDITFGLEEDVHALFLPMIDLMQV